MDRHFKIEIRTNCKVCGSSLPKRFRTYCSTKCRTHAINQRHAKKQRIWQRKRKDKLAVEPSKDKIQCLICNRWYTQICSHVFQRHKITARKYKVMFGLDVKRGLIPKKLLEIKRQHVFKNNTVKNLKKGKPNRFKKNDPCAGIYPRSAQTLERLKNLSKYNKAYIKKHKHEKNN